MRFFFGFFRPHNLVCYDAALALVNALTQTTYETPFLIRNAQVIDKTGDVRFWTQDRREFIITIRENTR